MTSVTSSNVCTDNCIIQHHHRHITLKFPMLWSVLCCYTVKCSEMLAHTKLHYNPRVNKVFTVFTSPCQGDKLLVLFINYMAHSVSRQDELTSAVLSYPLGITPCFLQENSILFPYNKSFIDQALHLVNNPYMLI